MSFFRLSRDIVYKGLEDNTMHDELAFEHLKFISEQTYYLLNNSIDPLGLDSK